MPTPAPRPFVIVTCGGRKRPGVAAHPAGELYTGTYHRLCQRAALSLTDPDRVRILSARHGLVALDALLQPYDTRIGEPTAITTMTLREQTRTYGLLDQQDVLVLAGAAYARLVRAVWPHAHAPLAGAGGIGHQQHLLATIARTRALPDTPLTQHGGRSA